MELRRWLAALLTLPSHSLLTLPSHSLLTALPHRLALLFLWEERLLARLGLDFPDYTAACSARFDEVAAQPLLAPGMAFGRQRLMIYFLDAIASQEPALSLTHSLSHSLTHSLIDTKLLHYLKTADSRQNAEHSIQQTAYSKQITVTNRQ